MPEEGRLKAAWLDLPSPREFREPEADRAWLPPKEATPEFAVEELFMIHVSSDSD